MCDRGVRPFGRTPLHPRCPHGCEPYFSLNRAERLEPSAVVVITW